jgi:hypothetical protein
MTLLKTPVLELKTKGLLNDAFRELDAKYAANRKSNEEYRQEFKTGTFNIIKDDLGVQGILNHADGKMYDSKSAYYKSLKESGHIIHEAGMNSGPRKQRGDYDVSKELKEAAQRVGLIG